MISKEKIERAHKRISKGIHNTPVLTSQSIDKISGCRIYFKCENFQKIGAFKMRGALNAILSFDKKDIEKGFVTHSSGNHAQAVALSSKICNTKSYIIMPKDAPKIKIEAVKSYGAEVILCENNERARISQCNKILERTGANFIHPYDNYDVILGQATCAKELYEDKNIPRLDNIICPVGGGGLASGTIKATEFFSPETKVVLSEPENASDAHDSFNQKKLIPVKNPNTIADGLKTSLSKKTFNIIVSGTEEIITVSEAEIINSMKIIWERLKIICEPSCSLPLAAILKNKSKFRNKSVGIILTGGNIDLSNIPF